MKEIKLENSINVYMGGTIVVHKPKVRMCFRGKEIKKLVEQIEDNDTLVFTQWSDFSEEAKKETHYSRWSVIKHT